MKSAAEIKADELGYEKFRDKANEIFKLVAKQDGDAFITKEEVFLIRERNVYACSRDFLFAHVIACLVTCLLG